MRCYLTVTAVQRLFTLLPDAAKTAQAYYPRGLVLLTPYQALIAPVVIYESQYY